MIKLETENLTLKDKVRELEFVARDLNSETRGLVALVGDLQDDVVGFLVEFLGYSTNESYRLV